MLKEREKKGWRKRERENFKSSNLQISGCSIGYWWMKKLQLVLEDDFEGLIFHKLIGGS